jgi:O-antigen ligase
MVWLIIAMMIIPQGLDYAGINGMPSSSDGFSRFAWLYILGVAMFTLISHRTRAVKLIKFVNPFLLLFLAIAFASYAWSIQPSITLRRAIRAFTIIAACMAFVVVGWHRNRFQETFRSILTAIVVGSVIFVLILPDWAIHSQNQPELLGAWHGLTMGKNVLGSLASTCILLWLNGYMSKEVGVLRAIAGAAPAVLCLAMSRSATSIVSAVFAVSFMVLLLWTPGAMRRYMPYMVGMFAVVILTYALAILRLVPHMEILLSPITTITGKDLTFTGRSAIWEVLNDHIRTQPYLGNGYGAYWVGAWPTSPSWDMLIRLYFYPSEGHNGYLDLINDLGLLGGVCLLGYFASYVKQALVLMRVDRPQAALYLTMLFRGFLADMSESHWFLCLAVDFVLMTFATMALARSSLDAKLAASSATPAVNSRLRRWKA